MRKKVMSWVLTFAMLLSTLGALPLTASADSGPVCQVGETQYDSLEGGIAAVAAAGGTVVLLDNISYSGTISIASEVTVTIDLNGYSLTVSGMADHALRASNNGVLNILDVDGDGGSLTVNSSGEFKSCAYAASGGDINITGNLTASFPGGMSYQEIIALNATGAGSTITLNGNATGYYGGAVAQNSALITVTGNVVGNYYGAYAAYGGSVDITGDVTAVTNGLTVEYGGIAEVNGDVTGGIGLYANNIDGGSVSEIDITGDVVGTGTAAISASNDADIDIVGNVFAEDGCGIAFSGAGDINVSGNITAKDGVNVLYSSATVTVGGDIISNGGIGINIDHGGAVTVEGEITGTSTYIQLNSTPFVQADGVEVSGYNVYQAVVDTTYSTARVKTALSAVCRVGETEYSSLDDAIAAANGDTITLLADINYPGQLEVSSYIDLNLNGHTLNVVNSSGVGPAGAGLYSDGEDIDVSGEGALNVTGTTYGVYIIGGGSADVTNATATADGGMAVFLDTDSFRSSITVLGDATADGANGIGVLASNADCIATVCGDVSAAGENGTGVRVLVGATVVVQGYIEAANYIDMQSYVIDEGDYITITDNYYIYSDGTSIVKARQEVCTLNDKPYLFLEDAFEAAGDGDTLTLLTNIRSLSAISLENIDLLLDLDTYTLETGVAAGDTPSISVDGGSLTIDESGGGKLNVIAGVTAVKVCNGATAEVSGITNVGTGVDADGAGCFVTVNGSVAASLSYGTGLVVKNGAGAHVVGSLTGWSGIEIEGSSVTVSVDGDITATSGMGLRVTNGEDVTVNGDISSGSYGVYAHGAPEGTGDIDVYGDVTATGSIGACVWQGASMTVHGDVTGKTGLQAREEGATLTVTGDVTGTDPNDYGAWVTGGGQITVGGTFTAANDERFVYFGSAGLTKADGVLDGRYTVYTDGLSSVRLKGIEFFKEDFEGGTMEGWSQSASGWSVTNSLTDPTATAHSGSFVAKYYSSWSGSEDASQLYLTQPLNLSKGTDYKLEFWMYHDDGYTTGDLVKVQVSTDGGSNWSDLGTFDRYSAINGWTKETVVLTPYVGQSDVRIAFLGIGNYGNNIFIDDITVSHECIIDECSVTEAYGGYIQSSEIEGETYYHVATPEQLAHIGDHLGLNFIQTADIDLAGYNGGVWVPIGGYIDGDQSTDEDEFNGKYLGDGHKVDNLRLASGDLGSNHIEAGLFARMTGEGSLVDGLTVNVIGVSTENSLSSDFGAVVGAMDFGTISNCEVSFTGDVVTQSPNGSAGGIAGKAYFGQIENCDASFENGSILTDGWSKSAGGILGEGASSIIDCHVVVGAGEMLKAPVVGGIAGRLSKMRSMGKYLEGCTVTGDGSLVLFPQHDYSAYIGGIVGTSWDGDIRNCDNEVDITANLTMIKAEESAYAGGIIGYAASYSTIIGCDNAGEVNLTIQDNVVDSYGDPVTPNGDEYAYAGGIAGFINGYSRASDIENCQNNANVKSVNLISTNRAYAGGIVGHIDCGDGENAGITIKNCANNGTDKSVEAYAATTLTGGIAGSSTYTDFTTPNIVIENCYNVSDVYSERNGDPDPESMCIGLTAGGIIGAAGEITVKNCYSTAFDVDSDTGEFGGDAYIGGVVGLIYNTAFSQNYYEINANVTKAAGGIVNGMDIVAQSDVAGSYQGATAQNLKTKSFFGSAWKWYTSGGTAPDYYSASTPWRMTSSTSYPALRGAPYSAPSAPSGGGGGSAVITYTITASAGQGGTISPSGSVTVEKLASQTFSIKANTGYKIADVKVDGKSVGAVSSYTFDQVAAKHTIVVEFEKMSQIGKYTDVNPSLWYAQGIEFVLSRGLFRGVTDTTFEPDTAMTRAMLVTVLHRLAGNPNATVSELFADVEEGSWFEEAVRWANANGVVNGYGDATFGPGVSLTREQLAVILFRYAKLSGYDTTARADLTVYSDAAAVSSWAQEAMRWAVATGLITGTSEATLDAGGPAGRAQVATILMRFMQTVAE